MTSDAAEIRSLLEQRAHAVRAKDAEAAVRPYASEVVNFDLDPPLAQRGSEVTNAERIHQWLATWSGPVGLQLSETTARIEGRMAFALGSCT
jgi:ketosteroid isomerase-like protein